MAHPPAERGRGDRGRGPSQTGRLALHTSGSPPHQPGASLALGPQPRRHQDRPDRSGQDPEGARRDAQRDELSDGPEPSVPLLDNAPAEPPQGEGQDGQAEEQQGPKDKKCRRCGNVGQYCHGDGLLCVDCFDELAHILRSFQRVPCICGASASEPCRTKSGKVISKAHKTRLAALDELNRKEWEEKHR